MCFHKEVSFMVPTNELELVPHIIYCAMLTCSRRAEKFCANCDFRSCQVCINNILLFGISYHDYYDTLSDFICVFCFMEFQQLVISEH